MTDENYDLADEFIDLDLSDLSVELVEDHLVHYWDRVVDDECYDECWIAHYAWSEWSTHKVVEEVDSLGNVEVVEVAAGLHCEDDARMVFRISNDEGDVVRHFAVDGVHCIDMGPLWGGELYEVAPTEKLITIYDRV